MPVREKRPPRPVASRGGPYGKPGRTVGMRRPRRPRRGLADAVFPIPAPNIELVGADGLTPARGPQAASPLPADRSTKLHTAVGEGRPRMAGKGISETLSRQDWLAPLANTLQQAVGSAFTSAGPRGLAVKDFLHGVWLGHPLHPVLTDVPLGAWTVALTLDALESLSGRDELGPGADAAIAIGLAGAVGAAATGAADWQATDDPARRVGLVHGLLNTGAALLYT